MLSGKRVMSKLYENSVSEHYLHGSLLAAIEAALPALGKTTESITVEDLASIDEFHIGGRLATDHLLDQLAFSEQSRLLDVGCGLGGAARYVASRYKTPAPVNWQPLRSTNRHCMKPVLRWRLNVIGVILRWRSSSSCAPKQKRLVGRHRWGCIL